MYGRNAAMQLRYGSIGFDGYSTIATKSAKYVDGNSDGYGAYDKHIALWHVPVDG